MPHIVIEEQGLRDGLQTLPQIIPTTDKLRWINQLVDAGVSRIQVASFVHPGLVPQMADAEAVFAGLPDRPDVTFSALVLRHLAISLSASQTHSQKNTRMTIAEAKVSVKTAIAKARQHGVTVRGGVQCAFGCRYEGAIDPMVVLDLVRFLLDSGVNEVALADSTGMGHPVAVRSLMPKVLLETGDLPVGLHLHNTENKGYANLCAALEVGIFAFDTAFGGLGGCPFIKGATGNIATEDTVHMLHQMGFTTGIDYSKISPISREIATLLGEKLPGYLYQQFL
jgi:hydroxymethylglutaryl-CoA lyase